MELGELVSFYRRRAGLTIDELAEKSGVPKSTINKIIGGTTKAPTLENVKAIAKALGVRLADFDSEPELADMFSITEQDIIKKYRSLDLYGKEAVDNILDIEWRRCEDDSQFLKDTDPEEEPKIIPLYLFPAAAGYASPVFNEDYENYELKPEDPQGATFAVRLQGDSMEPDFPDGSIVFCNKDPLIDGDIGVFNVDSGSVCKQYHKEGGIVYLFSLNRARQDADVILFPSGNRPLSCQGRVITKKRYRVPGR